MQEKERGAQDKAVVAEFMLRVAQFPAPVQLPDPSYLWCRAALMYRTPNRGRVLRLLTFFEAAEVAACLAAAVALFYISWATAWNLPLGRATSTVQLLSGANRLSYVDDAASGVPPEVGVMASRRSCGARSRPRYRWIMRQEELH